MLPPPFLTVGSHRFGCLSTVTSRRVATPHLQFLEICAPVLSSPSSSSRAFRHLTNAKNSRAGGGILRIICCRDEEEGEGGGAGLAQQPHVVGAAAPAGATGPLRRRPRAAGYPAPQARGSCRSPAALLCRSGRGAPQDEGAGCARGGRGGRRLGRGGHPGAPPRRLQCRGGFLVSVRVSGGAFSLCARADATFGLGAAVQEGDQHGGAPAAGVPRCT
jgi:hypothetical protein